MAARKREEGIEEKILESAFEMTKDENFSGFTTAGIAKSADVSEGTLYNYFENKTSLIVAVFDFAFRTYYKKLEKYIEDAESLDEILRKFIEYHLKFFGNSSKIFKLFFVSADKGIGPSAVFSKMFPIYNQFVGELIKKHRDEIKDDVNPEYVPVFIIGAIQMIILQSLGLDKKINIETAVEETHKLIGGYLLKKER